MSVDEVAQAQQAIGKTLAQAQLGEDRQLASVVREAGEQVARLFAGILRLPRLYELTNNAFVKPIESLLEQMTRLRDMLGAIHLIVVESQVYINDIRIRFDLNNETPRYLEETFSAHRSGGISFHSVPEPGPFLEFIARFSSPPDAESADNPRTAMQAWLASKGMPFLELHPLYRLVMKGEERRVVRADVQQAYQRSTQAAGELYGAMAMGRAPNTVGIRRIVTDLVDMNEGDQVRALLEARSDRASPPSVRHAIQVSNLAVLIGRSLGMSAAALSDLGVAAFMHDSGYSADEGGFPPPYERHTTAGARLLLQQRGYHEARLRRLLVTLQHHRRYDDPDRPTLGARIVKVADDFDTFTRERHGGALMAPHVAVARMWAARGGEYDPVVLQAFVNLVGPYPPGTLLELADGRWAAVVSPVRSPETFDRPLVRIVREADGRAPEAELTVDLAQGPRVRRALSLES